MTRPSEVKPGRRTVLKSAVWTAPVIVVAAPAPALAASQCQRFDLTWAGTNQNSTFTRTSATSAQTVVTATGSTTTNTIKFTTSFAGQMVPGGYGSGVDDGGASNLVVSGLTYGGSYAGALQIQQHYDPALAGSWTGLGTRANRQQVVVSFTNSSGAPITVCNLRLTITDIDQSVAGGTATTNRYRDRVDVSPSPNTTVVGADITGTGTAADPYKNETTSLNNQTATAGNITLGWNGPVSSVTLTYWNGSTNPNSTGTMGTQAIYLADITYDNCAC